MPFRLTVHHAAAHLLVQGEGAAGLADLCGALDLTAGIASRRDYRLAVLDLLGVEIDLGFTDHLQLGTHAAQRLGGMLRVASVVPLRYRTGTSEKAAQKSGLHLRTFTDLDEALQWVLAAARHTTGTWASLSTRSTKLDLLCRMPGIL